LEQFSTESEANFNDDLDFVATGTGTTVTDVPADYCEESVYEDLADAQEALRILEDVSAYAEWLAAQEPALTQEALSSLTDTVTSVQGLYGPVYDQID